jgi:hypothetical protein
MLSTRVKAISFPSGRHAGSISSSLLLVSSLTLLPFASMTAMSRLPDRSVANAIFVPSGEKTGSVSSPAVPVRRLTSEPFTFITCTSQLLCSTRFDVNTIWRLFGEKEGWSSGRFSP